MNENSDYDDLAAWLKDSGITKSSMFGMPVLKLGRRPIAGLTDDGINFKLPVDSPEYNRALALDGAHLFQPEMKGMVGPVMKQWVVVPFAHKDHFRDLAEVSVNFVAADLQ
jgi:hypothetical protein